MKILAMKTIHLRYLVFHNVFTSRRKNSVSGKIPVRPAKSNFKTVEKLESRRIDLLKRSIRFDSRFFTGF